MSRFIKLFVALGTAFALLFSQFAVAMHPCPPLVSNLSSSVVADSDCECPSETEQRSALCKNHCDNDKRNFATSFNVEAGAYFSTRIIAVLHIDAPPIIATTTVRYAVKLPHPPPLLKYANLRI